jgi:DMSO/TMAO reductase YedYZ molybdopterin-dependent catalytic subunit
MKLVTRRALIAGAGAGSALALPVLAQRMVDLGLPGGPSARPLLPRFPQKREMIVQRVHPPLLETPFAVYDRSLLTPNDRHFVRWHWDVPTSIDVSRYRVAVYGAVQSPLTLSLNQVLNAGPHIELTAVNQCAGNGRGLFEPRVAGGSAMCLRKRDCGPVRGLCGSKGSTSRRSTARRTISSPSPLMSRGPTTRSLPLL